MTVCNVPKISWVDRTEAEAFSSNGEGLMLDNGPQPGPSSRGLKRLGTSQQNLQTPLYSLVCVVGSEAEPAGKCSD
jgi:hypothetical protein